MIDGRSIARRKQQKLRAEVLERGAKLSVIVLVVGGEDAEGYLRIKQRVGERIGVSVAIRKLAQTISQQELVEEIVSASESADGVVVQLPLPETIDRESALLHIPVEKDIDFLSLESMEAYRTGRAIGMPPVAGAVRDIFSEYGVSLEGKRVGIVGKGKLVGKPVAAYLRMNGIEPAFFGKETGLDGLEDLDIVISGSGVPGLIRPEHIKEGAVIIDAGTSEQGGVIAGDVDPSCSEKASLFTPMPGGVGPITVTILFENVILRLR